MPLDSITVSALASELRPLVEGGKIDKVRQPERDTILLSIHGFHGSHTLALCGGVGNARVHVTTAKYEQPAQPPMFCMLLRKHLVGARITALTQPLRERVLIFELDTADEMGVASHERLAVEMIGRGTNIILIDGEGRIIDALRRVDMEMNSIRQVQPGMIYHLPVRNDKPDFFALSSAERKEMFLSRDREVPEEKWLISSFACLSPLICREMIARCGGDMSLLPGSMDAMCDSVLAEEFTPTMLIREDVPFDFSFMAVHQYGSAVQSERFDSFSSLLDAYYTRRSMAENMKRRTQSLRKTIKNARDRSLRKLALQQEELRKTEGREIKRKYGDLITANLWQLRENASFAMLEDYYEEGSPVVKVPMDKLKTPQQNAAAYYKQYNKLKTAREYLTVQVAESARDAEYLDSVMEELERVSSEQDITDIKNELAATGYLKQNRKVNPRKKEKESAPLHYVTTSGLQVYVGRNNTQNDTLTFKRASKGDMWFHVKDIHGSHVILCCDGFEPSGEDISEASSLAVLHSGAGAAGKAAVDYTRVKFVKKPAGALPGKVIYTNQHTLMAEANEALAEKMKKEK